LIFDTIGVLEIIFVIVGGVVVSWNLGLRVIADVSSIVSSAGFVRFGF
jgi:hypothetical protein